MSKLSMTRLEYEQLCAKRGQVPDAYKPGYLKELATFQKAIGRQVPSPLAVTAEKVMKQPLDRLNKTERRLYDRLVASGEWTSVQPHAMRLWLSAGLYYTPDFLCQGGLKPVFYECKGSFTYARALNKFKACVALFPDFSFRLCEYIDGSWRDTKFS